MVIKTLNAINALNIAGNIVRDPTDIANTLIKFFANENSIVNTKKRKQITKSTKIIILQEYILLIMKQ